MKKTLILFLVLTLVILPVSADALWEPRSDYYFEHADTLDYLGRRYTVPDGSTANLCEEPNGKVLQVLEAGTTLYIGPYGDIGGETWAAGYVRTAEHPEGWVRLSRLQLQYDHQAFCEDLQSEIINETLNLKVTDLKGEIPSWTYPGSGAQQSSFSFSGEDDSYNDGNLTCTMRYTDPDGGQWAYVPYHMQWKGWIYLDDLYTVTPPSFPQTAENTVTQTGPEKAGIPPILLVTGGVVALVLVTGCAILILKRRQEKQ